MDYQELKSKYATELAARLKAERRAERAEADLRETRWTLEEERTTQRWIASGATTTLTANDLRDEAVIGDLRDRTADQQGQLDTLYGLFDYWQDEAADALAKIDLCLTLLDAPEAKTSTGRPHALTNNVAVWVADQLLTRSVRSVAAELGVSRATVKAAGERGSKLARAPSEEDIKAAGRVMRKAAKKLAQAVG